VIEERHQPRYRSEAEQKWCRDPEDEPMSLPRAISSAICIRITTLLHEVKLPESEPEKHYDERDEDWPVWLQRRKIANPCSTDSQTQKQKRTYTTGGRSDTGQHSADQRRLRIER
jgi:hypothetical protein